VHTAMKPFAERNPVKLGLGRKPVVEVPQSSSGHCNSEPAVHIARENLLRLLRPTPAA
jgi:hypothetical protein